MTGNNVSHSNRKTKTRWKANVHKQTLAINGKPTRVKICSRCLRTMYKPPAGPQGPCESGCNQLAPVGPHPPAGHHNPNAWK